MRKPLFTWNKFLVSFRKIKVFACYTNRQKDATVLLSFQSPEQVKIFMYWMMELGKVDPYEAIVYLNDTLPEELAGANNSNGKDNGLLKVE